MKFLFLLWIIIRGTFDASVLATAVWCILSYFSNVLWLQYFGIFYRNPLHLKNEFLEIYWHSYEAGLLGLYADRIGVGWFIDCSRTDTFDPSDRRGDRAFKPVRGLDPSGNSLVTHLAFCRLCHLQSFKGERKAKDGSPCK